MTKVRIFAAAWLTITVLIAGPLSQAGTSATPPRLGRAVALTHRRKHHKASTKAVPKTPMAGATPAIAAVPQPPAAISTPVEYGPSIDAERTSAQLIPDAEWTPIELTGVRFDTDGAWSAELPTKFVAPVAGIYSASAVLDIAPNPIGERIARLVKGVKGSSEPTEALGELLVPGQEAVQPGAAGNAMNVSARPFTLDVGDWIELDVYQNSGAPLEVMGDFYHKVEFGMTWQRPLP